MMDMVYGQGVRDGVRLMEQKMLYACENGKPIEINGRAFFVKSDKENLQELFKIIENL